MMRRLWLACCVLVPMLSLSVPMVAIAGIWFGSGRLLAISGVLLLAAVPSGLAFGFWTDVHRPKPNLPRAEHKRLRDEAARIRVEKEIADMEREAGLR